MSAKVIKAWVAKAAKRALALEAVGLEPLGSEDAEIAVERCGLCHSDLSVLQSWSKSVSSTTRYRASRDLSRRFTELESTDLSVTGPPPGGLFSHSMQLNAAVEP